MSGKLHTSKNAKAMLLDRLLSVAMVGLFSFALARYMSVEDYAKWSIIATYTGLLVLFARGGLDSHILVNHTNTNKEYSVQFVQLKLIMVVPVMVVTYVLLSQSLSSVADALLALFLMSNSFVVFETVELRFKAQRRFHWIISRKIKFKILGFLVKIVLFGYFRSLEAILFGFFIEYLLFIFIYSKYLEIRKISHTFLQGIKVVWKPELSYLIVTSIVIWTYMRFAFLYIAATGSSEEIAQFYLSNKIMEVLLVLPPILVVDRLKQLKDKKYRVLVYDGGKILILTVLAYIFAGTLPVIFGPSYHNIDSLVRIMIWVLPIVYIGEIIEKKYLLEDKQYAVLLRGVLGLCCGVVYVKCMSLQDIFGFAYLVVFLQAATNLFYPILKLMVRYVRVSLRQGIS